MLVDKVTHHFEDGLHTMDLTLEGAWGDKTTDMLSFTMGSLSSPSTSTGDKGGYTPNTGKYDYVLLEMSNYASEKGTVQVSYCKDGKYTMEYVSSRKELYCDKNTRVSILVNAKTYLDLICNGADWNGTKGIAKYDNWNDLYNTKQLRGGFNIESFKGDKRTVRFNWQGSGEYTNKYILTVSFTKDSLPLWVDHICNGQQKTTTVMSGTNKIVCDRNSTVKITRVPDNIRVYKKAWWTISATGSWSRSTAPGQLPMSCQITQDVLVTVSASNEVKNRYYDEKGMPK
jgi:hypothetical protein